MNISYLFGDDFDSDFRKLDRKNHSWELRELDGIGDQLDLNEFSKRFFSKNTTTTADVSVDANANVDDINVLHYEVESTKAVNRLNAIYNLWKYGRQLFDSETAFKMIEAQFIKSIYINDMHRFALVPYCNNYSLIDIMYLGLPYVKKIECTPPKHLSSFISQVTSFATYAGNSTAGAVGLSDIFLVMSYYVSKLYEENKNVPIEYLNKQIKQEIQQFVFSMNQPFRGGLQSIFCNISIYDDTFLNKWCGEYIFIDGTHPNKDIVRFLQEVYIDLMNETLEKTPITFPITTVCFAIDDEKNIIDKKFLQYICKQNVRFAFMNIFAGKSSLLSSCCRLRSNGQNDYFSSFGNGGAKIGSLSVVTLNLPRLAYMSKNEDDFLEKLKDKVVLASQINHVKRHIIKKRIDNGHLPLYTLGFIVLKKQYSTCGLVGINEAVEIMGKSILNEDGQNFVKKILSVVNDTNNEQQKKYGYPINCEQTPSESSALKLAQADKILGYNKNYTMYSNQFIPLTVEADLYDRIKLQGMFDSFMSGGSIGHFNFIDPITPEYMERVIVEAVKNGVIYHACNYNLQICENKHITVGKKKNCPICGKKITDNLTRIVGYLTNVKSWAEKRREEDYPNRQFYKKEDISLTHKE